MEGHAVLPLEIESRDGSIALVGHPNVGKSVIFQKLTGQRVNVSNYPGTTVEVSRGSLRNLPNTILVDTPGVVAFPPHSEDEKVTGRVLLYEPLKAILQVGDAKNLRRTLNLTVQLAEMGVPLVLALNMMDEAQSRGIKLDHTLLSEYLSVQVIPTTAIRSQGIEELTKALDAEQIPNFRMAYPVEIEKTVASISTIFSELQTPISNRSLALLWLSGDPVTEKWLQENILEHIYQQLYAQRHMLQLSYVDPLAYVIQGARLDFIEEVVSAVMIDAGQGWRGISSTLGQLATHPVWGWVILAGILYGVYWFVGVFGAGILVGLLEEGLFGQVINPWVAAQVTRLIPLPFLVDLLVGEYGLWTMGITYALALILPIVSTFFLAFGVLEDSGYLPRLAALSNRLFQRLGLNGKAVLPMVLGLGCVTMATLTTRMLETKRERILVILLLSLAIPCSAQLGVVMGILGGVSFTAVVIWSSVVAIVLLTVGFLAAHLMPGERTQLLVELPPMRWPVFSNVTIKTLARIEWYIKEVVPLFLLGTGILFILDRTGILQQIIHLGEPLVAGWLGLPPEASAAFLIGFLRRDFGATGLFIMQSEGLLTPIQVVVAMVTITLFIPCLASVLMIAKERGWRTALAMVGLIMPLAFLVGGLLYRLLFTIGWGL
ncbi:MAG: ferrous iron transport protein B [Anaerolineales bacterium]|jgi:ferrous iron transport protein B